MSQPFLMKGVDANGAEQTVLVGTDGGLTLNLTGEGLALDVSVDGLETAVAATNTALALLAPTTTAGAGIAAVVSASLETGHVIKASAGNLYGFNGTTTSAAGYFLVHNSTTVPAAGAVTPVKSYRVAADTSIEVAFDPPLRLGTGISISFSSAATPFTQTDSATAFISGDAV